VFVYLDETGDSGFKFGQGSSRYFVVTLLLVDDPIPVHSAIDRLRRDLKFSPTNEFKFSHSSNEVKDRFLREFRRHEVWIRALVVDKHQIAIPQLRKQETFYHFLVRLVLANAGDAIANATLVLDESVKSRKRKLLLGSYLRQALNDGSRALVVRDIVHHASHTDNLIQAVDMASGAIYRAFSRDDDSYVSIIRPRIQEIRIWHPEDT
jgi:hypothetical protein